MARAPEDWLPADESNPWRRREARQVYANPWFAVEEHQVVRPDGRPGIYGVVKPARLALGIVALDQAGYTWLVGQYRYPLGRYSWEIPEGGGDPHADPAAEAARELSEETGLTAAEWRLIQTLHTSNCFTSETALIYLARDLVQGRPAPDDSERLQVVRLPFRVAFELAAGGVISDAMSVAAIFRVAQLLADLDLE